MTESNQRMTNETTVPSSLRVQALRELSEWISLYKSLPLNDSLQHIDNRIQALIDSNRFEYLDEILLTASIGRKLDTPIIVRMLRKLVVNLSKLVNWNLFSSYACNRLYKELIENAQSLPE